MSSIRALSKVLLASALALLACDRAKEAAESQSATAATSQPSIQPISFPADNGPLPKIDHQPSWVRAGGAALSRTSWVQPKRAIRRAGLSGR